jgi:hypothetical protein
MKAIPALLALLRVAGDANAQAGCGSRGDDAPTTGSGP